MNILDFSNRRGTIVHLLPQVYALLKKEGVNLPNIIIWKHAMNKAVVEIHRKWVFALEGNKIVKGLLFYHLSSDGKSCYIDSLVATDSKLAEALLKKFEQDDIVKERQAFYISRHVKKEASEEVLETVGLQDESVFNEHGFQPLGGLADTVSALKVRYLR